MADLCNTWGQCCNSANLPFHRVYKAGICHSWDVGFRWSILCDCIVRAGARCTGRILEMVGGINGVWWSGDDNATRNRYFFGLFGSAGDGSILLRYVQYTGKTVPGRSFVRRNSVQVTDFYSWTLTDHLGVP